MDHAISNSYVRLSDPTFCFRLLSVVNNGSVVHIPLPKNQVHSATLTTPLEIALSS
jgi:hypothetical protein